jgi:hypothetical protein
MRIRVPRGSPHIRIDRGGSNGQGNEGIGIVAAIIVFVMLLILFG